MEYLPIFLRLSGRNCLVVGGGEVAARKVSLLLKAGARVTVLAPELGSSLTQFLLDNKITHLQKLFSFEDVRGYCVVVSATNSSQINSDVAEAANHHDIAVNVVDKPESCSFIFPSIIDRSPVIAAISTGGASPVLARMLRERLESLIPSAYGKLATLVREYRQKVKDTVNNPDRRREFWESTLQGHIAELVYSGQEPQARDELDKQLQNYAGPQTRSGAVYLVGAGPGDPDLLTFRALRLMQQADVVVYDRLVSPAVLDLVRRDAEKIYAGKKRSQHTIPQEKINDLLARHAKQGKQVVRLKGGDPFIFGRGGEEIETLMQQGIAFQVIPGITAASGCASYAGIPLTHRDYAQSCAFVTGHLKNGDIDLNWAQLVVENQTLVIYMGLLGLRKLCQALIDHGANPTLPAALVERGTTATQRVFCSTLETLADKIETANVKAPTLIIVGEVVNLHSKLAWFKGENRQ